jgi:RimJ/RimL family protein N-acetyltransferase
MTEPPTITTPRLHLVPTTTELLEACLLGSNELSRISGWRVPGDWPAKHWDDGAVKWLLERRRTSPETADWGARFVLLPGGDRTTLIGTVGAYGPPDTDGIVEIGYGIVEHLHRRGYGSEAAAGLITWLWQDPRVKTIIAHTLPGDPASSGVLRRNSFTVAGIINRPPDGDIERFELTRD